MMFGVYTVRVPLSVSSWARLRVPFKGPFGMETDITVKRPRLGPVINGGWSGSHYSASTV